MTKRFQHGVVMRDSLQQPHCGGFDQIAVESSCRQSSVDLVDQRKHEVYERKLGTTVLSYCLFAGDMLLAQVFQQPKEQVLFICLGSVVRTPFLSVCWAFFLGG